MNTNSPLRTTNYEEVVTYQADKTDLNPYDIKEECEVDGLEGQRALEEMQVSSFEGYVSPPRISCEANVDEKINKLESTSVNLSLPVIGLGEVERARDYGTESVRTPIEDYDKHEHSGDAVTTIKVGIGDSFHYHRSSSEQGDDDHYDSTDREYYDKPKSKSSTSDEKMNDNYIQVSVDHQTDANKLNEEMDDENYRISYDKNQMGVGGYSSEVEEPENVQMVWENSLLQSPQETQNASLSPVRRISISAERSLHTQAPPEGHTPEQEISSPVKFDLKSTPSPLSSKRRHSSSPQKEDSSRDPSSPFKRTKSPIERESKRESHHRNYSPRRNLSRSPRKNDSPRKHDSSRKRGRSKSKSPRRRGSPGHQKDRQYSRSRSPIARSYNIRSPRRQSPRRRSPPNYHSRQRPPRRPLAPRSNRKSGIGRPGKNLFIAGFSYMTTERDLEKKFSKFGRVTDVRVVRDRSTGDSRGFGFLSLERDEDADAAIRAVDQTEWNGRILLVEKSKASTR